MLILHVYNFYRFHFRGDACSRELVPNENFTVCFVLILMERSHCLINHWLITHWLITNAEENKPRVQKVILTHLFLIVSLISYGLLIEIVLAIVGC